MKEEQQKPILVYYINPGNVSRARAGELFRNIYEHPIIKDDAHNIILPITNGNSRVECINPKLVSEEEYQSAKEVLKRAEDALLDFLKNLEREEAHVSGASCDHTPDLGDKIAEKHRKLTFFQKLIGAFKGRRY